MNSQPNINFSSPKRRRKSQAEAPVSSSGSVRTAILAVFFCVVALLCLSVDFVLQPQRFPMKHINVEGDLLNAEPTQIRDAITSAVQSSNILRIDIAEVAAAAQENPWVENAQIKRRWPDTLVVYINERVIRSRWNDSMWLDQHGIAVEIPGFYDHALPHLKGPSGREQEVLAKYQSWRKLMQSYDLDIVELRNSKLNSWDLILEYTAMNTEGEDEEQSQTQTERFHLKLGIEKLQYKIDKFLNIYEKSLSQTVQYLSEIDMRYPDGVAIRWKDEPPQFNGLVELRNT